MSAVKWFCGAVFGAIKSFWRAVKEYEQMRDEQIRKGYEEHRP